MKLGFKKLTDAERISMHSSVDEMYEIIISRYGNICNNCGFNDIRALHIVKRDRNNFAIRISPDREIYKFIISNEEKFKVICANCKEIEESNYKENKKVA